MSDEMGEREIRELFEHWWRGTAAKDIDAAMAPIASNVVSYEHQAPLQYRDIDAIKEGCQQGFDLMKGDFRWDVPDLPCESRARRRTDARQSVEAWARCAGGGWRAERARHESA